MFSRSQGKRLRAQINKARSLRPQKSISNTDNMVRVSIFAFQKDFDIVVFGECVSAVILEPEGQFKDC